MTSCCGTLSALVYASAKTSLEGLMPGSIGSGVCAAETFSELPRLTRVFHPRRTQEQRHEERRGIADIYMDDLCRFCFQLCLWRSGNFSWRPSACGSV